MRNHEARAAMRLTPPSSPLWSRIEAHVGIRHKNWKVNDGEFPIYWAVGASKEEATAKFQERHGPFTRLPAAIKDFLNFWFVANITGTSRDEIEFDEILPGKTYGLWGDSGSPLVHTKTDKLAHPHPKGTTGA